MSSTGFFPQPAILNFCRSRLQSPVKNALYLLEIHRRDEAVTDPNLFKLVTGGLVVRPRKPQQDQILVAGSELANQAKHLVVGSIRSFQIENKGFKRDLVEKWQYLFAGV